ncbi:hypothetical protein EMCG_04172 [[Emmonsia] crescens]|uniref:Secreted protein n=1 Tax=[Emmonsia] crescens TaxID=73230 RepID=A0A0G2HSV3_9EURO|nr:hypothetical protein EMCG_04172 [Emmonsia crescens UAMH 3008]
MKSFVSVRFFLLPLASSRFCLSNSCAASEHGNKVLGPMCSNFLGSHTLSRRWAIFALQRTPKIYSRTFIILYALPPNDTKTGKLSQWHGNSEDDYRELHRPKWKSTKRRLPETEYMIQSVRVDEKARSGLDSRRRK